LKQKKARAKFIAQLWREIPLRSFRSENFCARIFEIEISRKENFGNFAGLEIAHGRPWKVMEGDGT
jgi:hypothetical protein